MNLDEREEKPLSAAERMRQAALRAEQSGQASSAPTPQKLPALEPERTAPDAAAMSAALVDMKRTLGEAKATLQGFTASRRAS